MQTVIPFNTSTFRLPQLLVAFLCILPLSAPAHSTSTATVTQQPAATVPTQWQESWPIPAPLNIEWLGQTEFDGITIRRLRFTGSVWGGQPQRIYAIYAEPAVTGTERLPAILQIHGGGQTCYPENVNWFVKHGYACLAFDWSGPRDERPADQVTHWLPGISTSLTDEAPEGPKQTFLFHAVLAARRAIDILAEQPTVDPARIGVQGVSWGGQIAWVVAALDSRVRAVVPVYGAGGEDLDWNSMGIGLRRERPEWVRRWTEYFDPRSLAGLVKAPVFLATGTNDFFGQLHTAEELLESLHSPHWRSYGANRMHSLDPETVAAAMGWLDSQLKVTPPFPAEPTLELLIDAEGKLMAKITTGGPTSPQSVAVNLARGETHDLLKSWLTIPATQTADTTYECELPIISSTMPIAVIAQATYSKGMMISSKVQRAVPARDLLSKQQSAPVVLAETSLTFSGWEQGTSGWYIPRGTDFTHAEEPNAELSTRSLNGRPALVIETQNPLTDFHLATRLPADAGSCKGNRNQLEIWTHDVAAMNVRLNWFLRQPAARSWEAEVNPGAGWVRTILQLEQFHKIDEDSGTTATSGISPRTWNDVNQVDLLGQTTSTATMGIGLVGWTGNKH